MRRIVHTAASVLIMASISGYGCSQGGPTEAEKTKVAILKVLKANWTFWQKVESLPPKSTPAQISRAMGNFCNELERLDMSACPADFRVAFKQHIRACREAQTAIQQLPNSFLEGVLLGAFNSSLRGEIDGGTSRLEGGFKRAVERVRVRWEEVEKIGAKYGAAL